MSLGDRIQVIGGRLPCHACKGTGEFDPATNASQRAELGKRVLEINAALGSGPQPDEGFAEAFVMVRNAARSLGLLPEVRILSEDEQRIDEARAEAAIQEPEERS